MRDDPLRWCRRIFASVDVVGSTAFKLHTPSNSASWAHVFKDFFDEFPTTLRASFEKMPSGLDGRPDAPMRVWKYVGDEILFVAELDRHEAAAHHVIAFRTAITQYSRELSEGQHRHPLGLKGAVWGAGFPVMNVEVAPKLGSEERAISDYLGPCIDQGFRLCRLADQRRIPISADIMYMLATTQYPASIKLRIHCEEPQEHKGVAAPYPFFWLDRVDGGQSEEDKILKRREDYAPSQLMPYLQELFGRSVAPLHRPFIESDPSEMFKRVPMELMKLREELRIATVDPAAGLEAMDPDANAQTRVPPPVVGD